MSKIRILEESEFMRNCPVCNKKSPLKTSRFLVQVYHCSKCGMVFAHDDADKAEKSVVDTEPNYYKSTITHFDRQVEMARSILPGRIRAYEDILGRKLKSVLEIGCGAGAYSVAFNELDIQYKAVEIAPEIARIAKEKTGADILCQDFSTFVPDTPFDVVFASQVVEHVREPRPFLRSVRRAAPNGMLHIDVPNHDSLISTARKFVGGIDYGFIQPPHHMLGYTEASLAYLLLKNDFHDVKVMPYRNDHPVWGQLVTSKSIVLRAAYAVSGLLGRGSLLTAVARV